MSTFSPILTGCLDVRAAIGLGDTWTLVPDLRLRTISHFGEEVVDGILHTNYVGGMLPARYTDDQLPFFGLSNIQIAGDYLVDAVVGIRCRPINSLYLTGLAGLLAHADSFGGLFQRPLPYTWALGAEAAYDTIAGPARFNLHWSNGQGWGAYLAFGFDF